jgi:hypothetical protein
MNQTRNRPTRARKGKVAPGAIATWVTAALERLWGRVFLGLYHKHRVCGITVVVTDPRTEVKDFLARIELALELLRDADPRRFRIVERFVNHILVWPGDHTAYDGWGGIHLASRHVLESGSAILASALVHEATHLRIAKRGIPYARRLRSRIERACVKEQAAFLRRLPGEGPRRADEVEAGLQDPWWND